MSIIDPNKLNDKTLITQYIIHCRGEGLFLPYSDYQILDKWLALAESADRLLLVLEELLPPLYEKRKNQATKGYLPQLQAIDKAVRRRLEA